MNTKNLGKKAAVVGLSSVVLTGVFLNQQYEINKLEEDLYIQKNMTEQKHNYTETIIDVTTLREQLNEDERERRREFAQIENKLSKREDMLETIDDDDEFDKIADIFDDMLLGEEDYDR